jgi:outer membrane protein assembly factor BamB
MMRHLRRWSWLAAAILIVGCSKDKTIEPPAKLLPFQPTLRVERVWEASVGSKNEEALRIYLGLSVDNNRVYAAGYKDGVVGAFDVKSGKVLWRVRLKAPLSGGTAAAGDLVVVGAANGQVFALDADSGKTRWGVRVNGEVLAPAAMSGRLIALRTADGKLHALSPTDGHELWSQEQQVPRLSLRGTASPMIVGDVVLCGFDNGKVVAVNGGDGSVAWEATVTPPHGRTELERLADIDSSVQVQGQNVYAVGFQGRVAMLALETGQIWWSHELSSYRGMGLDDELLYVATAEGEVVALRARTGAEVWRQSALLHRGLSAPASVGDAILVGDAHGYVHWLDKASGGLAARVSAGSGRISTTPVVVGNMVLVVTDRGHISAYRVSALAPTPGTNKKTPPAAPPAAAATPSAPPSPAPPPAETQ